MNCIKLNAGNDRNGNPRRVFVVFNMAGEIIDAVDEGYRGSNVVTRKYPELTLGQFFICPIFDTTPKEYRNLLKTYNSKD